eukprot:TRINITY_DN9799_c0_g1_i1.p1 TRINITY_DN9799_c0_g1~~TRINITY_DN9799_c0_g1_i1.p1  ORF type:complete len:100 (-),score=31.98 TRINITY_DN9799_c0_g1_i1:388-687(-)
MAMPEGPERKIATNISRGLLTLANEPSMGLYYVQQHYRNAVRPILEMKAQVQESTDEISAVAADAKYTKDAVDELVQPQHFDGLRTELQKALAAAAALP